jgi:feruloyl-CoA synthase
MVMDTGMKGPMVTPGYFGRPDLTAAAFDGGGYYRTGDAVALADPDDPNAGLVFRGRIAEDFKLGTGTFARAVARHNADAGSSGRIERLLVMARPAGLDAGEITDKGYVNQRRVLANRAALVELLYAEPVPGSLGCPEFPAGVVVAERMA